MKSTALRCLHSAAHFFLPTKFFQECTHWTRCQFWIEGMLSIQMVRARRGCK
jgi:hypothetical protein